MCCCIGRFQRRKYLKPECYVKAIRSLLSPKTNYSVHPYSSKLSAAGLWLQIIISAHAVISCALSDWILNTSSRVTVPSKPPITGRRRGVGWSQICCALERFILPSLWPLGAALPCFEAVASEDTLLHVVSTVPAFLYTCWLTLFARLMNGIYGRYFQRSWSEVFSFSAMNWANIDVGRLIWVLASALN